jgi:hypothetical protein
VMDKSCISTSLCLEYARMWGGRISRPFQKRLIESSVLGRVFRARFPLPQARRATSIQSWDIGETSRDLLYSDAAQLWKPRSAPQPKVLQPRNPNNRFSEPFETCCAALVSTFVTALFDSLLFFETACCDTGGFRIPVDHMYRPWRI